MAERRPASGLSAGKHRSDRAAPGGQSGGLRGRRRRETTWTRFVGWLGFGRRAQQERELLAGHVHELRLATATLRAELSVLRIELEQAMALAAQRRAENIRMAGLLPLVVQLASGQRGSPIYLDFSPDVAQLGSIERPDVIELERKDEITEIVLADHSAAESQRRAMAAVGHHRRTA